MGKASEPAVSLVQARHTHRLRIFLRTPHEGFRLDWKCAVEMKQFQFTVVWVMNQKEVRANGLIAQEMDSLQMKLSQIIRAESILNALLPLVGDQPTGPGQELPAVTADTLLLGLQHCLLEDTCYQKLPVEQRFQLLIASHGVDWECTTSVGYGEVASHSMKNCIIKKKSVEITVFANNTNNIIRANHAYIRFCLKNQAQIYGFDCVAA